MEEAVTYATVTFKAGHKSTQENQVDMGSVYDELRTEQPAKDIMDHVMPEKNRKAQSHSLLDLLATVLGVICVILVSALVALSIHFTSAMSERENKIMNLTAQNGGLQKQTEELSRQNDGLQRQTADLSRQNDGLNWTLNFIMEYDNFPVKNFCPQKVCKPCDNEWLLFESHCYHFKLESQRWQQAREICQKNAADLVVIETQEEQEFISNQTKQKSEWHHFWIGLKKEFLDQGIWVNGRNLTVKYWTKGDGDEGNCVKIQPDANLLANWKRVHCNAWNYFICEKRTLIKPE